MYRISKRFDFSASHHLEGLRPDHQCGRNHGHNYSITVFLESQDLDHTGFVLDYGELGNVKEFLDKHFEHRNLNEVVSFQPSAENLAEYFYMVFKKWYPLLVSVQVKETDKTTAEYTEVR